LTDFRLVATDSGDEISLNDIGDIHRSQSLLQNLFGLSTLDVQHRDPRRRGLVLRNVRRGPQLAPLIELVAGAGRARGRPDAAADARATMAWEPRVRTSGAREALPAIAAMLVGLVAVAVGLHGKTRGVIYPADDAIYPNGAKKGRQEIVR